MNISIIAIISMIENDTVLQREINDRIRKGPIWNSQS